MTLPKFSFPHGLSIVPPLLNHGLTSECTRTKELFKSAVACSLADSRPCEGSVLLVVATKCKFQGVESPKRSFLVSWTMSDHNFFLVIRASLISFVETFGSFLISKDRISEYVSCFNRWSSTSTSGKILFLLHDVSIEYNFRKLVFKLFVLFFYWARAR